MCSSGRGPKDPNSNPNPLPAAPPLPPFFCCLAAGNSASHLFTLPYPLSLTRPSEYLQPSYCSLTLFPPSHPPASHGGIKASPAFWRACTAAALEGHSSSRFHTPSPHVLLIIIHSLHPDIFCATGPVHRRVCPPSRPPSPLLPPQGKRNHIRSALGHQCNIRTG